MRAYSWEDGNGESYAGSGAGARGQPWRKGKNGWKFVPGSGLGGAVRVCGLGRFFGVRLVQANAGDAGCFLGQVVVGERSVSDHDGTGSEGETESVSLIVEIKNDLPGHKYFSLGLENRFGLRAVT